MRGERSATVTDAAILAPKTDGVIIVYRAGRTPRSALRRAKAVLDRYAAGQDLSVADVDNVLTILTLGNFLARCGASGPISADAGIPPEPPRPFPLTARLKRICAP